MTILELLPAIWQDRVLEKLEPAHVARLSELVEEAYEKEETFPPREFVFRALSFHPPEKIKVVILGQDPYHDDGQAHGLSFSVPQGIKFPPSLRNIFKELSDDLGAPLPTSGDLEKWAEQGVLLLNTTLTVRAHTPLSHSKFGWERVTDAIIQILSLAGGSRVFVLWGAHAQAKRDLIDTTRHLRIESAHPSPLSARRGFFGSKPFSTANEFLKSRGIEPIDWFLP